MECIRNLTVIYRMESVINDHIWDCRSLYVNPYVNTTWAEFYKVMRENALETGNATREELIGLRKEADI